MLATQIIIDIVIITIALVLIVIGGIHQYQTDCKLEHIREEECRKREAERASRKPVLTLWEQELTTRDAQKSVILYRLDAEQKTDKVLKQSHDAYFCAKKAYENSKSG